MKLVIVRNIFLVLFITYMVMFIFSFIDDEHNLLDLVVSGLSAITSLLSFLIFHGQIAEKEDWKQSLSDGFIRMFYIITIVLFFAAGIFSFIYGQSSHSSFGLAMGTVAQIAALMVFIKQSKSKR